VFYTAQQADRHAAGAVLVDEPGLVDYLARRFAVYGTPKECGAQFCPAARRRRSNDRSTGPAASTAGDAWR
jgi:hypothetical protein